MLLVVQLNFGYFSSRINNGSSANAYVQDLLSIDGSQNATFGGEITIPEYIVHSGDTDTYFGFPAENEYKVTVGNSTKIADADSAYLYYQGTSKLQTLSSGRKINW